MFTIKNIPNGEKFSVDYDAAEKECAIKDQLAQAKGLLKQFLEHYKAKTIYVENMSKLLEQTEQFFKENE